MKLDEVKKLHQKKYRGLLGHYLVEGEHLILELIKATKDESLFSQITLYITDNYVDWVGQHNPGFSVVSLTQKQMAQLSDTKSPQGIIACVPLPSNDYDNAAVGQPQRSIYLHEVQDPGNLGTIIRTLAWFGGFRLLLSPNSVDPYNPKVVRASMGAIFHLPIKTDVSLAQLQERYSRFAYLDLQGQNVSAVQFYDFECYLFGNEARGVPQEALAQCKATAFTIAGCGAIDSLNLASSVNICAYQLSSR